MDTEEAIKFLDAVIDLPINHVQELVLRGAWEEKTYAEMSAIAGYDPDYLRDVGSKLWRSLSHLLGQKINKNNFRCVLRRQLTAANQSNNANKIAYARQPENQIDAIEIIDFSNFLEQTEENAPGEKWLKDKKLIRFLSKGEQTDSPTSLDGKIWQLIYYLRSYPCWLLVYNQD